MQSQGTIDLRRKKSGGHIRRWSNPLSGREKPRSPLRAKRQRTRALLAFALLSALGVGAFGLSSLSYMPRLSVDRIIVSGAKDTRPEVVRTYLESQLFSGSYNFLSRANIFLYPRSALERALTQFFPRIRSATITRSDLFAQAIAVQIEERVAFARWCAGEQCYVLDREGFVFAPVGSTTQSYTTAFSFAGDLQQSPVGKTYLRGRFASILALLEKLGQSGFTPHKILVENEQDFSVRLVDGLVLRASFGADVNGVIRNLELVLASDALKGKRAEIDYIDLRFGNRVYYKLKGATAEGKLQNE